jgi:hypothetical protein
VLGSWVCLRFSSLHRGAGVASFWLRIAMEFLVSMGLADMVWRYRSRMSMAGQHLGGADIYWGSLCMAATLRDTYFNVLFFGIFFRMGMGLDFLIPCSLVSLGARPHPVLTAFWYVL